MRWIVGCLIVLVVGATATWTFLTITEPDPPSPGLVATVQGVPEPSDGGGRSACLSVEFAAVVAQNAAFNPEFRVDAFDVAASRLDAASEVSADEVQSQTFELVSEALRSDTIAEASDSAFALDDVIAERLPTEKVDELISVFDDC